MNLYDNKEDLKTIIVNASEYFSFVPAIIEKDYYVTLINHNNHIGYVLNPLLRKWLNIVKGFMVLLRIVHHLKIQVSVYSEAFIFVVKFYISIFLNICLD